MTASSTVAADTSVGEQRAAIVEVDGLRKSFGDSHAVLGMDLQVHEGEFVTLLGPSGCGKTTTLRCIAGLEVPTAGTIRVGGRVVQSPSEHVAPHRRALGMVFQTYAIWPHMTVFDNVAYPLRRAKVGKVEIASRVRTILDLTGLGPLHRRYPGELSGGQQQRVALARAVVSEPRIVLYDEPLSNLDARLRDQMRVELRRLHTTLGMAALYVTHDQQEAMELSDRVYVMNRGEVAQSGAPSELYARPVDTFVARSLGAANALPVEMAATTEEGALRLVLAGGDELALPDPGGIGPAAAEVILRPHRLRLVGAAAPTHGAPAIAATVRSAANLGDRRRYALRTAGGLDVTVDRPDDGPAETFTAGDQVLCLIDASASCLVPRS